MRVKNQMKNSKRKAFTLVELLVVIAIIGILFVVLISKVDFATDKAKATGVQTDFRSYQLAIETVARENAGLSVLVDKDAEGDAKYAALEAALNKNLDPKLHVEIDANGKISTKAKDPWKEEYLGAYLAPDEDGTVKDRGAIIMYSKGSNLKLGTDAVITNGVVSTSLSDETAGKDDFKIAVVYTYANGYGEIQTTTEGFSNDMKGGNVYADNGGNVTPTPNPTPGEGNDPEQGGAQEPEYPEASVGLAFIEKDDGTYELVDIGTCTDTDIVIPATYEGKPVTGIGDWAFGDKGSPITSVVIPGSVKEIGVGAFVCCDYLESVTMYNGVVAICGSAFAQCPSLTSITIPDSVTIIGDDAFGATNINSIVIPAGVTSIGKNALTGCNNLSSIMVKSGNANYHSKNDCLIETASKTLIAGCNNSIIPTDGSVTSIGESAFSGRSGLTSVTISDSITSIGNYAFSSCTGLTSIEIPNSVTSIGEGAFGGCSGLTSVTISDNITSISGYTFRDCDSLASITIPAGVTSIGDYAFEDCFMLKNITFDGTVAQWDNVELGFYWDHGAPITQITCNDGNVAMYPVFGIFSSATTANVDIRFDYKTYDEDHNLIDTFGSVWGIGSGYDMSHYYDVAVGTEIVVHTTRTCRLYYYRNIDGQNTKIYLDENVIVDTENQVTYITLPDVGSDIVVEVE